MVEALKTPEQIDHAVRIVAVCQNGRTRSKEIARVLDSMGYNRVLVLGIRDPYTPTVEKLNLLNQAQVIICASPSEKGDVTNFLHTHSVTGTTELTSRPRILNLGLSENLHIRLRAQLETQFTGKEDQTEIRTALEQQGFKPTELASIQVRPVVSESLAA